MGDANGFEDELQAYYTAAQGHPANQLASEQAELSLQSPPTEAPATSNAAPPQFIHPALPGFKPTPDDIRYWYHADQGLWYDATSGVYSRYDASTFTYQPVDIDTLFAVDVDTEGYDDYAEAFPGSPVTWPATEEFNPAAYADLAEAEEPAIDVGGQGTLRLVVQESPTLPVGHIAVIDTQGTSIGRDRLPYDRRLRIMDMATSKYHAIVFHTTDDYNLPTESALPAPIPIGPRLPDLVPSQGETLIPNTAQENDQPRDSLVHQSKNESIQEAEGTDGEAEEGTYVSGGDEPEVDPMVPAEPPMGQFYITDCGSQHGTLVNGTRLSAPKQSSRPHALAHGDVLTVGTTTFTVHHHPEIPWGCCAECQINQDNQLPLLESSSTDPSTAMTPADSWEALSQRGQRTLSPTRREIAANWSRELKRLKHQYSHTASSSAVLSSGPIPSTLYVDRAAARRDTQPTSRAGLGPPASHPRADVPPKKPQPSNAQKMMLKMGWSVGKGLGKDLRGRTEPVAVKIKRTTAGLGAQESVAPTGQEREMARLRALTRKRYEEGQ
ncbi:hypothetical protein IWQ60_001671 [Tieghemiomyces parasiticus]|uniref:G-patch domain-containing protein n=1 Tax=Tieghemiomyces parasiticus TaxID=78921 RepID=A0A9W8AG98_9FUNG|nr:hypothetical protein IWQ60_001671 [Tieghemiomyces parasiticus]